MGLRTFGNLALITPKIPPSFGKTLRILVEFGTRYAAFLSQKLQRF